MTTPPSPPPPPKREPEGAQAPAGPRPPELPAELWGLRTTGGVRRKWLELDDFSNGLLAFQTHGSASRYEKRFRFGAEPVLIGVSPAVREQRDELKVTLGLLKVSLNLALECAEKRLADVPELPCRVDEMTNREQRIFDVAAHQCGALLFIRRVLDEARLALTEIEGGGRVGTDKGEPQ